MPNSCFLCTFALVKNIMLFAVVAVMFCACGTCRRKKVQHHLQFTIDKLNKITPVKNQGMSDLCWVYAMLATIESDRLMQGDSVNLSPHYVARMMLRRELLYGYTSGAQDSVSLTAMSPRLLRLLELYGAMPFDSYRSDCNYHVLCRRLSELVQRSVHMRTGIDAVLKMGNDVMDESINPMPQMVFMLGAEYTPEEFARSVCMPGDYQALTSFTHLKYYKECRLDVPDNRTGEVFYNVPIDTLMSRMTQAIDRGYSVCWEGDITEPGFSFAQGVAQLQSTEVDLSQLARQHMFETFQTTDDHCMELIGLAHDEQGKQYFVCKNSWGTGNQYHGLMFMSIEYARMKTVAAVMRKDISKPMRK